MDEPEVAQYQGIYVRYYQAFEGTSFATLRPHPLYDKQEPVSRLLQNIRDSPNAVQRGKAFLLLEYVRDHLFLSADVEHPADVAFQGPLAMLVDEGMPDVYVRHVPLDGPGVVTTDDQRAFDFLHATCRQLLLVPPRVPQGYTAPPPGRRDHPEMPTLRTIRALLQQLCTEGHIGPLSQDIKATLRQWRRMAAEEDLSRMGVHRGGQR